MVTLRSGHVLDRYTLVRQLGGGGQGEVWQAFDPLPPGRQVALKLVLASGHGGRDLERARREARLLAALSHPALVRCDRILEDVDSLGVVLVMELAEGTSLDALLDDPRMTRRHREALMLHVAEALAALHQAGVVHRDLKPANVVIGERFWVEPHAPGVVKLVDLGISVEVGNPRPLTVEGRVVGTTPYMAPEVIAPPAPGPPQGPAPAIDVFALGVFAWEVFLGAHPSGLPPGSSLADFAVVYHDARKGLAPWPARPLDHPWSPLLLRCLALDPRLRPATASEVVAWLWSPPAAPWSPSPPQAAPPRSATDEAPAPCSVPPARGASLPPPFETPTSRRGLVPPAPPAPRSAAPRRSRLGLAALALGLVALGSAGALGLVLLPALRRPATKHQGHAPTPRPPSLVTAPASTTAAGRAPAAPAAPVPPTAQAVCVCEPGRTARCNAERGAIHGLACDAPLPPDRGWRLRLSHAYVAAPRGARPIFQHDPRARLRICTTGPSPRCKEIRGDGAEPACQHSHRLLVSTEDLLRGLRVELLDARGHATARRTARHDVVTAQALCKGLVFRFDARPGELSKIAFFLDDAR